MRVSLFAEPGRVGYGRSAILIPATFYRNDLAPLSFAVPASGRLAACWSGRGRARGRRGQNWASAGPLQELDSNRVILYTTEMDQKLPHQEIAGLLLDRAAR